MKQTINKHTYKIKFRSVGYEEIRVQSAGAVLRYNIYIVIQHVMTNKHRSYFHLQRISENTQYNKLL